MTTIAECILCKGYMNEEKKCFYKGQDGTVDGMDYRYYITKNHHCANFERHICKDKNFANNVLPQIKQAKV